MRAISNAVLLSWGWRRALFAFLAGVLAALALAPLNFLPGAIAGFTLLTWLIDGAVAPARRGVARLRPAAVVGWWFGFGYFLAGLWWIGSAFLVEPELFGWLMPVAVVALPAGLALFFALGVLIARMFWSDAPVRLFALAGGVTVAEWLRGHILTGFPWNLVGQSLGASEMTMQAASVVGVYGLTFLAVLVFSSPALLGAGARRGRPAMLALALALLLADLGYGAVRLGGADDGVVEGVALRIVQPAIDQSRKWTPEGRAEALETYLALSDSRGGPEDIGLLGVTHLVWPETAVPFFLTESPNALAAIAEALPPGTLLLTGAPRAEGEGADRRYFNSVYAIDGAGEIVAAYDKAHLVPFGEYVPLAPLLERIGLRTLVRSVGGFSAGRGPVTLSLPGAPPFGVLVCYEIIFPGAAVDPARRPQWIVNVTNDGWFGMTSGPYQHLAEARMRAVEEGLPVVRAANTGISAIIDGYGRLVTTVPLGVEGVADGALPVALPPTIYARHGGKILAALLVLAFTVTLIFRARSRGGVDNI